MLEDWNHPRTPADDAIRRINTEELYRRRQVRGRDLNDWHAELRQWEEAGLYEEVLSLLGEITHAVETLAQYDSREPQAYWYLYAARILKLQGEARAAEVLLIRWLDHWPEDRPQYPSHRARVEAAIRALRR
ncbi:hypothetical protein [Nesterenkonia sp. HG001]|uniref:hypothetical protein n=1 Tax=Nesterenkonia sp. HG001 TaxID=2983207 RepID=UPI002AC3D61D|nr:hypothetical protein [Nesterenkonia sp. HG001]MDZ5076794.1 hypothetical protein [Nesterenkonia sp. HG001]